MTELVVIVPMTPAAVLSPNTRVHWRVRHRAAKSYRELVYYSAGGARPSFLPPVFDGPVQVAITIAWERRRKRLDADNALAIMKSGIDGLQDARIVQNDKQCRFVPVEQGRDPAGIGFVKMVITEVEVA